MNFFKKIFNSNEISDNRNEPDNTRLRFLLNEWGKNPSGVNFEKVMGELVNGNSYLMLPSINKGSPKLLWEVAEETTPLKLTCIHEVDGQKVLGAFSDEYSLLTWSKNQSTTYTSLKSQDVLKLCVSNNIEKIVINSGSPEIFLVRRFYK